MTWWWSFMITSEKVSFSPDWQYANVGSVDSKSSKPGSFFMVELKDQPDFGKRAAAGHITKPLVIIKVTFYLT